MPSCIVKIKDRYLEWSTVVDAPITFGMTLDDFKTYYRLEYGEHGMAELDERLARVEKNGTSMIAPRETAEQLVKGNRAGPHEAELSWDELYEAYGLAQPIRGGWKADGA